MKTNYLLAFVLIWGLIFFVKSVNSQGVAVNTDGTNAHASAMLDVKSSSSGILIPRMTQAQRNAISSPATSLLIYQTDNVPGYYYWDGSTWVQLFMGEEIDPTWDGDANTTSDIGRTGKVGIGTTSPSVPLYVDASSQNGSAMIVDRYASGGVASIQAGPSNEYLMLEGQGTTGRVGINFYSSGNVSLANGGGDVGVGTNSPTAQLHTTGTVRLQNYTNGFLQVDGVGNLSVGTGSDLFTAGDGLEWSGNTLNSIWKENGTHIYNGNSGNVGVGTTTPDEKLEVSGRLEVDNGGSGALAYLKGGADDTSYEWVGFYSGENRQGIMLWDGSWSGAGNRSNEFSITAENGNWLTLTSATGTSILGGNVGVGTTAPSEKLEVTGNIYAPNSGIGSTDSDVTHISKPGGAALSTSGGNTGAIKIRLPQSWSSTMMKMNIEIFDYSSNESFTVKASGYNYGSGYWTNSSAQIIGSEGGRDFTVRFGYDGSKCAVYIGETSSSWSYLKVNVTDFIASHNNNDFDKWDDGWDISMDADFSDDTFTETNNGNFPYSDWNNMINIPAGFSDGDDKYLPDDPATSDVNMNDFRITNSSDIIMSDGGDAYIQNSDGYIGFRPHDATHGLIIRDFDGSSTAWSGIRTQDNGRMELCADGSSYSQLQLQDDGDVIMNDGNVGIGTTAPSSKLDVDHGSEDIAVRGEGEYGPTNGYLGVQGDTDFDGITTLDISGNEIGVLGVSTGSSSDDNFGVYGHSNGNCGVFGITDYESGAGLYGEAPGYCEVDWGFWGDDFYATNGSAGVFGEGTETEGSGGDYDDKGGLGVMGDGTAIGGWFDGGWEDYMKSSQFISLMTEKKFGLGLLTKGNTSLLARGNNFGIVSRAEGIALVTRSQNKLSAYHIGNVLTESGYAQVLKPETDNPSLAYSVIAREKQIIISGSDCFNNGSSVVHFDQDLVDLIEDAGAIFVNITPTGFTSGDFAVVSKSHTGFEVALRDGEDISFDYMVIVKMNDQNEIDNDILDSDVRMRIHQKANFSVKKSDDITPTDEGLNENLNQQR